MLGVCSTMNTHNLWTTQVTTREFFTKTWRGHQCKVLVSLILPIEPHHLSTLSLSRVKVLLTNLLWGKKTTNQTKKHQKTKPKTKQKNLKKIRDRFLWVEYWHMSPEEVPFQLHSLAPAACCLPLSCTRISRMCRMGRDWHAPPPELWHLERGSEPLTGCFCHTEHGQAAVARRAGRGVGGDIRAGEAEISTAPARCHCLRVCCTNRALLMTAT